MAYKDKEKQKQADRIRQQRRRDANKAKGVTKPDNSHTPIVTPEQTNVIPLEWPENEVTPSGARLLEEVFGKGLLETGLPDDKPRATDPDVQDIWDRRNAQGQAGGYSHNAESKDYPQTQRPHIKL